MSETSKRVNRFFKTAIKKEVELILNELLLTERQEHIFKSFYVRQKTLVKIADEEACSTDVVSKELDIIRQKIIKILDENAEKLTKKKSIFCKK